MTTNETAATLPDMKAVGASINTRITALEYKKFAAVATSGKYSDLIGAPNLEGTANFAGASFTGAVTVPEPTADQNPATKKYTDQKIESAKVAAATVAKDASVPRVGNRGVLSGYESCSSGAAALTLSGASPETQVLTAAAAITVANGDAATAYTKNVFIKESRTTITPGAAWKWAGGKVPEMKANSLLIAKWCGEVGVLSLVTTE